MMDEHLASTECKKLFLSLDWCHRDVLCSFFVFIGGLFFAKPMREKLYVTVLDPFQVKYGKTLTAALSLITMLIDVMWVPASLSGLGMFQNTLNLFHTQSFLRLRC